MHKYCKDVSEYVDWKDFRYSVLKTDTWIADKENMFGLIEAFKAWRHQSSEQALIDLNRYLNSCLIDRLEKIKMSQDKLERNEELKESEKHDSDNVLPFERPVLSHGGDGGGDNWLSSLPEGTVFLSRRKTEQSVQLDQWHISVKWTKGAVLYANIERQDVYMTIDMTRFSKQHELVEVLRKGKMETFDDNS